MTLSAFFFLVHCGDENLVASLLQLISSTGPLAARRRRPDVLRLAFMGSPSPRSVLAVATHDKSGRPLTFVRQRVISPPFSQCLLLTSRPKPTPGLSTKEKCFQNARGTRSGGILPAISRDPREHGSSSSCVARRIWPFFTGRICNRIQEKLSNHLVKICSTSHSIKGSTVPPHPADS